MIFAGFADDFKLAYLYRRCDVFAMPYRQETFGLIYLEAMRAAMPCFSSNRDVAQEIALVGEAGDLVDPDDRVALATVLTGFQKDDELRRNLGSRGRPRFLGRFSEGHFQTRFWKILRESLPVNAES